MAKYNVAVLDSIGNEHKRKNKYILELAQLSEKLEVASSEEKVAIKVKIAELKKNKQNHPYVKALNEFKQNEKKFKSELKEKKKKYQSELKSDLSSKVSSLKTEKYLSGLKRDFYKKYIDLTYDAEYYYEESMIVSSQLEEVINFLIDTEKKLAEALVEKKQLNANEEAKFEASLKVFKKDQKMLLEDGKKKLKEKKKNGLISEKAVTQGIIELKKAYKEAISVKAFDSKKKSNKELISNLKYQLTKGYKRERTIINSNISDLRRKIPVEIEKTLPVNSFISVLVPGVGQLLNGQYLKSILFFGFSIFTYLIAIPYALGYGNYQGTGISGLVTLAEGARKIDKSIIFMIEGILAIILLVFAVILIALSFRDAFKVEKSKIKGVRPKNWFETRTSVFEEGFPYIVSLPALVSIVFIVLIPILTTILVSFTGMDPKHQTKFPWVGIENYKMIAMGEGIAGSAFWNILGWTIVWTICSTTLAIAIGFFLAILTNNERVKFKSFFRSIYILPWAVPAFITIMFFSIMFSPKGALTEIITYIAGAELPIVVKNDPFLSRLVLILMQGWLGSAYVFLLSTGVLQAIPADLYEAAQIDGASAWQKLRKITLPIVLFQTAPLLVGQYTFNFNNFSVIYLFNSGGPFNPSKYGNLAGSTDLLISYIFKLTTEKQYQSIGAAITMVISIGLMLFAFIGFKNSKAFKEEKL